MQKKLKSQEYDLKINPLKQELEQVDLHITLISESIKSLGDMLQQNQNESQMIEEDIAMSDQIKVDLIIQREELEGYHEQLSLQLPELQNLLLKSHLNGQQNMDSLLSEIFQNHQRKLLYDLIRELQQYILGMSSGTTDTSMMQSDELEEIDFSITHSKITHENAVDQIIDFAERKLSLQLNKDTLMAKLEQIKSDVDANQVHEILRMIMSVEDQMKDIDQRIKVISNRCQNELRPRIKALLISKGHIDEQLGKLQDTEKSLLVYRQELQEEIDKIQLYFEQSFGNNDLEIQQMQQSLEEVSQQIQELQYDIEKLQRSFENCQQNIQRIISDQNQSIEEHQTFSNDITSKIENLKILIKQETQRQTDGYQNQVIEQLSLLVAQSKCDKESSSKRLKYLENKLQNAQDSVSHAKQVLENHILQAQQEKLNQKIHQPAQKRMSLQHANSGSIVYGQTQTSRISTIQQKGQTLQHGEILSPTKEENRLELKRYQSVQKEKNENESDQERMHSHFIESNQSEMKTGLKRTYTSDQKLRNSGVNDANLMKEKSTIDVVRYYYESSSALSSEESQIGSHYQNFIQKKVPNQQRMLPIQNFITPRDPLHELQNTHNFIYESYYNQMSAVSNNDSLESSAQKTDRSILNENVSFMKSNGNHLLNRGLKQHNSSYDGKALKNVVIPLYSQFKENVTPKMPNSQQVMTNGINIRKLSQATNISKISNYSILNTIQSGNRPPAVPQSKNSGKDQSETPRGSSVQKEKRKSIYTQSHHNSLNASKDSFINQVAQKPIQTKLRLQLNVNNLGRPLQIGVVDLARCNKKDEQFYEGIKPLTEGAQFLVGRDSQYILKQFYLDFSLLRLNMVNFNGDKDVLMIENLVKPELPQITLDQIRQEKGDQNQNGQKKRYEFSIVISQNGNLERLHLLAMSYDELKLWIVGLNALIQNRSCLMKLSCQIQINSY